MLFRYLKEIKRCLKPEGKAFFSTSDITSPGGWERFEKQSSATVGGFCCKCLQMNISTLILEFNDFLYFDIVISPDIVKHMIYKAGLEILVELPRSESNVYYNRDFCVVVKKPN